MVDLSIIGNTIETPDMTGILDIEHARELKSHPYFSHYWYPESADSSLQFPRNTSSATKGHFEKEMKLKCHRCIEKLCTRYSCPLRCTNCEINIDNSTADSDSKSSVKRFD